jgi:hypothetical protein
MPSTSGCRSPTLWAATALAIAVAKAGAELPVAAGEDGHELPQDAVRRERLDRARGLRSRELRRLGAGSRNNCDLGRELTRRGPCVDGLSLSSRLRFVVGWDGWGVGEYDQGAPLGDSGQPATGDWRDPWRR